MANALTDLHQSKRGLASVVACLVQTLNEIEPTFQERFLSRLEAAYNELRDNSTPGNNDNDYMALEPVAWVQELLSRCNLILGRGQAFLSHYEPK